MVAKCVLSEELPVEEYLIKKEPYYVPVGNEVEIFMSAYRNKLPINLKGPTGCGKNTFYGIHGLQITASSDNRSLS